MKLLDLLETSAWAEEHFGSLVTSRNVPLRDMRRAVKRGMMKSVGQVVMCDGDGFMVDSQREREGYRRTKKGIEHMKANGAAE